MPLLHRWKHEATLLFVVTVWGSNFAVIKVALAVMHPHVVNVVRFATAALVLGTLYLRAKRRAGQAPAEPLRAHGGRIVALGLLGYVCYQYCFIMGVAHTSAGSAALIMASAPLWTAVYTALFGLDRLPLGAWIGLAITLVGTVVIVLAGPREIDFSNDVFLGNAFMLAAAMLWGAYTAFSKPLLRHVAPLTLTFFGLLVAFPVLLLIAAPHGPDVAWDAVTPGVWIALVYSGALSIGYTVVLWNAGVQRVGPAQTAAFGNLVPFIALLTGAVFLHEAVTPVQLAGGALIIGGIVTMRRTRRAAAG